MNTADKRQENWKHRISQELIEYGFTFIYLAFFFSAFTWYRRLILAEYKITYLHYGIGLVKALILAKIVLLGGTVGLGRRIENKPLIFPTLYNTVVFCLWVLCFDLLEYTITALLHGKGLAGGVHEILGLGRDELLARSLLTFSALIPFFALKELGQVMGETRLWALFFQNRGEKRTAQAGKDT